MVIWYRYVDTPLTTPAEVDFDELGGLVDERAGRDHQKGFSAMALNLFE
jgi:hypothetical protein